jgi:predicted RecA/RadA family phage recombinase
MDAMYNKSGEVLDYTPAAAVLGGDVVLFGGLAAVVQSDIAASQQGSIVIDGAVLIRKKDELMQVGLPIWWDANGNPKVGTAGSGAATTLGGDGMAADDILVGSVAAAAAAADEYVLVRLNQFSPKFPAWPNRYHLADTTGTLDNTDGGKVLRCATADQTFTLPEIATVAIGTEVIIINDCADAAGSTGLRVTPHANDGFNGFGVTHAVNKYLTLTAATGVRGDFIRLLACGDTHWQIIERKGVWARQG